MTQAQQELGELIISGVSGLELSSESRDFFKKSKIGGIIFFKHNYENPKQITKFIQDIQECRAELPLWMSVDQEGGLVQRFKEGFTRIPSASELAGQGSPQLVFETSELVAKELKAVGINLNYTPVADILTQPNNPAMKTRTYGSTAEDVSKMISAVIRGHLKHGVQCCVKHFPGHGDTWQDSHFDLPTIETSLETLEKREFLPFMKAFRLKCSFVMTSHIVCKKIDPQVPATFSKKILKDILRNQLGYKQIIISDDLEMQAVTNHFPVEETPCLAIEAGCDLVTYRTEKAAQAAYQNLQLGLEKGSLSEQRVLESAQRLRELKKKCL